MKKVFILSILISTVALSGCGQKKSGSETFQTVKTDTVRIYSEKETVTYPGKIRAASDINLSFRISGPIAKVNVDAGNYVRKGQILTEIDSRDYAVQLSATKAEYEQIKAEAERIIALYEKGSIAPNDHDKAVYGLRQITAKYDAHRHALADTKLRAPFDGYVQQRFFNAGETVGAGTPVISMISSGQPEVEINIPSSDFIRSELFDQFSCTVDIFPDKVYALRMVGVTQKANLNQLHTVRLRIADGQKPLPSPGMSAMVAIRFKPDETALFRIPLSSVLESDGKSSVWLYKNDTGTVEQQEIRVLKVLTDGTAIVADGLSEGQIVVSAGIHVLKPGEKVELLPPVSPTNVGGML